jgi:radical SAM protein with 4Fe4S-binding SPASM domain
MLHIKHYFNEHYTTVFNPHTGFFARIEDQGFPEPKWSQHGSELMDISITGWCDRNCSICYRNSSTKGKHMSLRNYESVISQAAAMGVLQVALGGGNPNQHPEFVQILKLTREKYGIVPSYTSNGRGLSSDVIRASGKYCGAVAISAYSPYEELEAALKKLTNAGIKTNIHFVLDSLSIRMAISWLKAPPPFLAGINAIIFLNYKPIGRQSSNPLTLGNNQDLDCFFELVQNMEHPFRIGFDSCMVSGLASFTKIVPSFYDACEAARFSMFVSEELMMYPCSFMVEKFRGVPVTENNILETWRHDKLFCEMRSRSLPIKCSACAKRHLCLGGCPILPDINLCSNT